MSRDRSGFSVCDLRGCDTHLSNPQMLQKGQGKLQYPLRTDLRYQPDAIMIADIYISISMETFEHRKYKIRGENGNN